MKKTAGFTLIEMILVLVIISIIVVMGLNYMQQKAEALRIDRTALQMQQILNAGLAYYVTKQEWPTNNRVNQLGQLQRQNFLPANIVIKNPWGNWYYTVQGPQAGQPPPPPNAAPVLLYVYTGIPGSATTGTASGVANVIAGKLPMSFTTATDPNGSIPDPTIACTAATPTCFVVASVNIPGQNLNNASAINYAGIYHPGGCVPAPQCPLSSSGQSIMTPEVILVPASVSGLNDPNSNNTYPIESFTAYTSDPAPVEASGTTPKQCPNGTGTTRCDPYTPPGTPTGTNPKFWRACLKITTANGEVNVSATAAQQVTIAAFTRCAPQNEFQGSDYTQVWSK